MDSDARKKTKIIITPIPGSCARYFDVAAEICTVPERIVYLPANFRDGMIPDEPVDERLLISIQENVPGVERVSLGRYNLRVQINRAFSWDEVEPVLLEQIAKVLDTELDIVVDHKGVAASIISFIGVELAVEMLEQLELIAVSESDNDEESDESGMPQNNAWGGPDGPGF